MRRRTRRPGLAADITAVAVRDECARGAGAAGTAASAPPLVSPRVEIIAVGLCLVLSAGLAVTSLLGDSLTFDETLHLTAGMSHLKMGDYRLVPQTPPLAQMWAAGPLLATDMAWAPQETPSWSRGDCWSVGRAWLFRLNDGERLLVVARCAMVVLLLATVLATYFTSRRLFGPDAGLLTLLLATLSPTLLAHGRLVTTDVPSALCFLLVLLTWARLFECISVARLIAAALAVAALCLVKFSWPVVLAGWGLMAIVVVVRAAPLRGPLIAAWRRRFNRGAAVSAEIAARGGRVACIAGLVVFTAGVAYVSIWACYGFRYSAFRGSDAGSAMMAIPTEPGRARPTTQAEAWEAALQDKAGQPRHDLTTALIRVARAGHLLPEAYLFGLAFTIKFGEVRPAYLAGAVSEAGWYSYFPVAFAIKTPLGVVLLLVAGVAALVIRRRAGPRDGVLLAGLVAFAAVYAAVAIGSRFNIGHRHLVPLYPVLFVVAGAAAGWVRTRIGGVVVAAGLLWVAGANLRIYPHYLSYFNELIGGPARGYKYLADSNVDWGQDLKRLATWARAHPAEPIKLAYFGSADPTRYGFACESLMSYLPFGEPAALTPGTYVASVTQLVGVYAPPAREEQWQGPRAGEYRMLAQMLAGPLPVDAPPAERQQRALAEQQFERLQRGRLLNRLWHRVPDERIGYSLFVYRLSAADLEGLLGP